MKDNKNYKISDNHTENLKELLIGRITQLGQFQFSDDSWYFSKKHIDSLPKGYYTITFYQVPCKYRDLVKYYALLSNTSTSNTLKKCLKIAQFFKFIDQHYPEICLEKITRTHVNAFEYELRLSNNSINNKYFSYVSIQDFFMRLTDFNEIPNVLPTKDSNPFRGGKSKQKELLPAEVLRKWDRAMKDQNLNIPLEFRTMYWLIRSFPNRITEVLSMKRDCIKSFYSEYVIQIPSFKQSGGYGRDEIKPIPVIYSGHGKYVIDLVKKLQLQNEELLSNFSVTKNFKTDFLFIVRYWRFMDDDGKPEVLLNPRFRQKLKNWTGTDVNNLLEQLALILNIRDNNGTLVIPKTHQFRHNAVTDRLYTVGYTTEQVRKLTGHKNEGMTKYYTHQLVEKHKEIHQKTEGLRYPNESPVSFRGKILNLDERTTQQLSKDSRRYLTWEANGKKGVGICSDITGCNPKGTSVHFECYACDWFVPKLEYYEDYIAEQTHWKNVIDRTSNDPKRAAHFENAVRNVSYLERIINICENGIEKFKEEKLQKQISQLSRLPEWE
jgi:integrase